MNNTNISNKKYLSFSPHNRLIFKLVFFGLLAVCRVLVSQDDYEQNFLRFFKQQSFTGKVNAFDTLPNKYKVTCYAFVKDELQNIRQKAIIDHKTDIVDKLLKIEGEIYFYKALYSKAIPLFTDLLAKNKIKNYNDSAQVLYYLKNSYIHLHSLNKAVDIHKTLMTIRKNHPEVNAWIFHPRLSTLYYEMKLYKECLAQQVLEYEEIKNNKQMKLGYFNNRGLFWQKFGNKDSAMVCFNIAKELFFASYTNKTLTPYEESILGLIEGNIGQVYMDLKEYSKAIPLLQKDIKSSVKARNFINAAVSEIELAKCYMELHQLNNCKRYLDSAHIKLAPVDDYKTKLNLVKQYAIYYDKIGQYRQSIDYYNKYNFLRDSFEQEESIKELITTQVANQMKERENMIHENQKKISEKISEVDKQKAIRNALLFGGAVLLLIVFVVSSQLKKTNNQKKLLELKNKQIETRNEIIDKSLTEKDLLIKEVHHRVKNNLQIVSSLLKLQATKSNNDEVKTSLNEAQERINSMALLHQLLYRNNQMTSLLFNEYLSNLISQISDGFDMENKNITIIPNLIALELDLDTAIPLGLIANELISNSYKHAFSEEQGIIYVDLVKLVKNTYMLKIRDNGKGLPNDFDFSNLDSLGLDIVSILSEQINAQLKNYNDDGACFEIIFTKI